MKSILKQATMIIITIMALFGCGSDDDGARIDPGTEPVVENVFSGDLKIQSQAELEAFFSGDGFTKITGNLSMDNVTNLSSLQSLTSVKGLYIGSETGNEILKNLKGLENLKVILGDLEIVNNKVLENIDALNSLVSIGGNLVIGSPEEDHGRFAPYIANLELLNIDGLQNVTSIKRDIKINFNEKLSNVDGLKKLTIVEGNLIISNNAKLKNLEGLREITLVKGDLSIGDPEYPRFSIDVSSKGNPELVSLSPFQKLTTVGGSLTIADNDEILNLDAFNALQSIGKSIKVVGNKKLTGISFLKNFTVIQGDLVFGDNEQLSDLEGFQNITQIDGELRIGIEFPLTITEGYYSGNSYINDLTFLNKLSNIGSSIWIGGNSNLKSLNGLQNMTIINPNSMIFIGNKMLTNFCALENIVQSPNYSAVIRDNAYNPTKEQLQNAECQI